MRKLLEAAGALALLALWVAMVLAICGVYGGAVYAGEGGGSVSEDHPLRSPVRLAFDKKGNILVSDSISRAIITVDPEDLTTVRAFRIEGKPLGLGCYKNRIYVGNESSKRVEVYDKGGIWLYNLGSEEDEFGKPTDIAVDAVTREVFVLDGVKKSVSVFTTDGAYLRTIPSTYPETNQLSNPTGIAVDPVNREVFVSDYGDFSWSGYARVHIYTYEGFYLGEIRGKTGGMFGGAIFSRPQGLAVDGEGHVLIVDCVAGEVQFFDRETKLKIKTLGEFGLEPGQLQLPLDLVMDPLTKDIFVANNRGARIEAFREGGLLP